MVQLVKVQNVNVPQYMSIKDASKLFGLSTYFLRKGVKQKTIKYTVIGNKYMIDTADLMNQLESGN